MLHWEILWCLIIGVPPLSDSDSSTLDVALNIECLLDKIPERKRNTERKQVRSHFSIKLSAYGMIFNPHPFHSCLFTETVTHM